MKKRYRNEWKYYDSDAKLTSIKQSLSNILPYDSYSNSSGIYYIHSLYFDDYKDTCARHNVAGESERIKYRIRYYGTASDRLWLERKEKKNSYCHKQKCPLTADEYQLIINGRPMDVFWNTEYRLLKEFCVAAATKKYAPKVIIDYERTAFVEPVTNIRITFDYNISASDEIDSFLTGEYQRIPITEKDKHVLEVKFDDVLPSHIKHLLQSNILIQQSFSKYYLGRIAVQEKKKYMKTL